MDNQTIPREVMRTIAAFTPDLPKIRLTKIACIADREPKVPVGQIIEGALACDIKVGQSFNIKDAIIKAGGNTDKKNWRGFPYEYWCTSIIEAILSDNTFETKNSVYKWERI